MNSCSIAVGGLFLGILATHCGCSHRNAYMDASMEIARAEKIDLEDRIYELEDELATTREQLERARARRPLAPGRDSRPPATPPSDMMDDADLTPPLIDPGTPIEPKIELPDDPAPKPKTKTMKPADDVEPEPETDLDLAPPSLPTEKSEPLPAPKASAPAFRRKPAEAEVIDPQVSTLFINPYRTSGVELDQQPGDDGIRLVFEPRNEAGQFVPQAGEVSIVLLDPNESGDAARVARWDLSKREVGEGILDARPERGVKLELPWPAERPRSAKLKLFVRYVGSDGERVETTSDIFIAPPGQLSQRWTPRR